MPKGHYVHKRRPPIDRFWPKVNKSGPDDCWPWTARIVGRGYGQFWDGDKLVIAHRFIFEYLHGPVSVGHDVCHSCDNPGCCNPAHLFVGTRRDNMQDCVSKGRQAKGPRPDIAGSRHYSHIRPHLRIRGSRHGQAKLTEDDVRFIRTSRGVISQRELARRFHVTQAAISLIQRRLKWAHVI